MNDEILKLAKEIWGPFFPSDPDNNQAFQKITYIYRAAYNAGIEAAAKDPYLGAAGEHVIRRLRELEMK